MFVHLTDFQNVSLARECLGAHGVPLRSCKPTSELHGALWLMPGDQSHDRKHYIVALFIGLDSAARNKELVGKLSWNVSHNGNINNLTMTGG